MRKATELPSSTPENVVSGRQRGASATLRATVEPRGTVAVGPGDCPTTSFAVDPRAGAVEERIVDGSVSVRAAHAVSPVHEGLRPGTYVPLER